MVIGKTEKKWHSTVALIIIIVGFISINLASQSRISWTVDEMRWIESGQNIVKYGLSNNTDEISHPLLFMLSQAWVRQLLSDGSINNEVTYARLGILPYQLLCLVILYIWAYRQFGLTGAIISTGFLAFSPTYLAHARLATSDAMLASAVLVTTYTLSRHLEKPSFWRGTWLTLALTFGFHSKFSFGLIPLLILPVTILKGSVGNRLITLFKVGILPLICALVLLNATYGFKGTGQSLNSYHLHADTFKKISTTLFGEIPAPVPERYIRAMDHHLGFVQAWPSFLLGRISMDGYYGYDFFAFLVKTTVPALLIICLSLIGIRWCKLSVSEKLALYFAVGWMLYFSFIHRIDCGVRYILPVYPLVFFFAGRISKFKFRNKFSLKNAGLSLLMLHIIIAGIQYPFYISFFNIASGGSSNGYRLLGDSNISWTQELKELGHYQEQQGIRKYIFGIERRLRLLDPYIKYRPITHYEKYFPSSGTYVIWIASLQTLLHDDPNAFLWFRLIEPDKITAQSAYIYNVNVTHDNEIAFIRKALQRNREEEFTFPWAEKFLDDNGGTLYFPLNTEPLEQHKDTVCLETHNAPPSQVIAVEPVSGAEKLQVFIRTKDDLVVQGRRLHMKSDEKAYYMFPEKYHSKIVTLQGCSKDTNIQNVYFVYYLEQD